MSRNDENTSKVVEERFRNVGFKLKGKVLDFVENMSKEEGRSISNTLVTIIKRHGNL